MNSEVKKNCNSCKFGMFNECKTLKENKEFQDLIDVNNIFNEKEWDFKENFICENFKSMYIEYPIKVSKINVNSEIKGLRNSRIGKFVAIRPCKEEYKNKTYLGIYLGNLAIGHNVSHNSKTNELNIGFSTNPAIFVFDLNKIIYGCESWWSILKSEKDLEDISDIDINNTWYVKVLNDLKSNAGGIK